MNRQQYERMQTGRGFIAALDQSGGSTPRALKLYGVDETAYSNEEEMFDAIHAMRTRIITNPAFTSDHILGAILFEQTMDREIEGMPTASYLWEKKGIVPFLKVDLGLEPEERNVQRMKPLTNLSDLLERAKKKGVFGTKMRSVINEADTEGIAEIVAQQFEIAKVILSSNLVPIIEPEINIHSKTKQTCETELKNELLRHLNALSERQSVMLKLTIPDVPNHYRELIEHPRVLRVAALSGGYTREDANKALAKNRGMIASFSRALTEGLTIQQTDAEFTETLDSSIRSVYEASIT